MIRRVAVLLLVGSVAQKGIEGIDGRPLNEAAGLILWLGTAVVIAIRAPLDYLD